MHRSSIFALASMVFVVWASPARACSCIAVEPRAARDAAVAVFEGVLVRLEDAADGSVATFRVDRVWKGDVSQTYSVASIGRNSMCPPHFEVGERYVVYVDASDAGPRIRQCARYAFGPQIRSERAALGRPIRVHGR